MHHLNSTKGLAYLRLALSLYGPLMERFLPSVLEIGLGIRLVGCATKLIEHAHLVFIYHAMFSCI